MVMRKSTVIEMVQDSLIPEKSAVDNELNRIDGWWHTDPEKTSLPPEATREHQELRAISEDRWLALVVTTVAQQLVVEAVRTKNESASERIWTPWQRNRMKSRQKAIHHAAIGYGYSYACVKPGNGGSVIRGRSPREVYAVYADAAVDEYPMHYLDTRNGLVFTDEEADYYLHQERGRMSVIDIIPHGVGVPPLIRYSNNIDLEGRVPGEVEPYIPTAKRINKTTYDRMLVQHHESWKIRTATGLNEPVTEEDKEKQKMILRQGDILTGGDGVEFGTLDGTEPKGFIDAKRDDIQTLASTSQTPSHALTGDLINLSADAITEARSMLDLKAGERKLAFGDSHAQTLRLAAHIEGRSADAGDFSLDIQWADLESRSMNQAADALGKMAQSLGIPPQLLWDRIPSVTIEEAARWREHAEKNPTDQQMLAAALRAQADGSY